MQTLEKKLQDWKARGHRMTKTRAALLDLFLSENKPLSTGEIEKHLKRRRITANPSTLYRELEFLLAENFLTEVTLDGKRRFELSKLEHHHHLFCTACESIDEIEMDDELTALELSIQKKKGFKVSSHTLEFFGLCSTCKHSQ